MNGAHRLRADQRRFAPQARGIAEQHGLDMPGAYSVLFGIMSPEEVRELGNHTSAACNSNAEPAPAAGTVPATEAAPAAGTASAADAAVAAVAAPVAVTSSAAHVAPAAATSSAAHAVHAEASAADGAPGAEASPAGGAVKKVGFDRDFQPAVDAGLLSAYQATQRGGRAAYAALISHRHGLPMEVAYDIADNRVSLLSSLRERKSDDRSEILITLQPSRGVYVAWAGACVVLLPLVGLLLYHETPPTPSKVSVTRSILGAKVSMDSDGRILQVAAQDPRSVLDAYCRARSDRALQAIDVVLSPQEGSTNARSGLFREKADNGNAFMIEIVEDRAAGAWIAGSGSAPIRPVRAPAAAVQVSRVPVRTR